MATKFIILTQVHGPKTPNSTRKLPRFNRNKPKSSKSILNNVFSSKRLTEIYHDLHPLTDSQLFIEEHSVKEEETKMSDHHQEEEETNRKDDGKSMSAMKYGELRREVARLSLLWYMRSSISYILRKARAFYNEFCCDTYLETNNNTMPMVDPYFSVPVLPF